MTAAANINNNTAFQFFPSCTLVCSGQPGHDRPPPLSILSQLHHRGIIEVGEGAILFRFQFFPSCTRLRSILR